MTDVYEHERLGPFWVTISDGWHPILRDDCIALQLMDGEWEAVPVEYFPPDTPVNDIWRRAVELTENKISKWRRELAEFRSLHELPAADLDAAFNVLTYDDLGAMLTVAGIVPHESLPGRQTQLRARLS